MVVHMKYRFFLGKYLLCGREAASIVGLALLVASCSTSSGPKTTAKLEDVVARDNTSQQQVKNFNDQLFVSVSGPQEPKDYAISSGDLVWVTIFEAQELNTQARAGSRGTITLPLIGPVEVVGLTTREAERKIEDLYRAKFLQDPHANIYVQEQHGRKITVVGAVKKPGTFEFPARRRLLDALALAEGLDEKAGRTIQVRRVADQPENTSIFLVDLEDLVKRGRTELNIEIKGGDVIFVPEAGVVYVDGAVKKPGSYPIKKQMSVNEAIVSAGGLATTAESGDIKLVRSANDGKREVIQLSYSEIQRASGRTLEVQDRDVIFVETNSLKALIYGVTIGLGPFGSFGYHPPTQ
jgi:polysaccharide biosynthesis/export protein